MCGENTCFSPSLLASSGSPPRVRGKHSIHAFPPYTNRITPACAGKTRWSPLRAFPAWDHPRVCGENALDARACPQCVGSPPRVRGKLKVPSRAHPRPGITPACAGKTLRDFRPDSRVEDHPRVCGENTSIIWDYGQGKGSPPRVRGKQLGMHVRNTVKRITPACAGKT